MSLHHKFDCFMKDHSRIADILWNRLEFIFKNSLAADMGMLAAICFAGGIYSHDAYLPFSYEISVILAVLVPLFWLLMAFENGFRRRKAFIICCLAYWLLPQIFIFMADSVTSIADYNQIIDSIAVICRLFVSDCLIINPFGVSPFICSMALAVLSMIMTALGWIFRNNCRKSEWYCHFRRNHREFR